ncbi:hypothetical protein BCR37DRAFT_255164 [Protomyces lactucae-debilis]|uniref:Copper-fist domain-containing protein n=1 Tax=Protomyces lactucae-debilis TaxID=2754530 RepID=A0A1Y2FLY2_PROLT|nr:uncharacterized protein BCR37DRAFT_255164 [Protomyces lactucae-debilis]ORY84949.1 hypothetical protein BCR37DRAFT_255164 [Protomyces lactucae-debilis]
MFDQGLITLRLATGALVLFCLFQALFHQGTVEAGRAKADKSPVAPKKKSAASKANLGVKTNAGQSSKSAMKESFPVEAREGEDYRVIDRALDGKCYSAAFVFFKLISVSAKCGYSNACKDRCKDERDHYTNQYTSSLSTLQPFSCVQFLAADSVQIEVEMLAESVLDGSSGCVASCSCKMRNYIDNIRMPLVSLARVRRGPPYAELSPKQPKDFWKSVRQTKGLAGKDCHPEDILEWVSRPTLFMQHEGWKVEPFSIHETGLSCKAMARYCPCNKNRQFHLFAPGKCEVPGEAATMASTCPSERPAKSNTLQQPIARACIPSGSSLGSGDSHAPSSTQPIPASHAPVPVDASCSDHCSTVEQFMNSLPDLPRQNAYGVSERMTFDADGRGCCFPADILPPNDLSFCSPVSHGSEQCINDQPVGSSLQPSAHTSENTQKCSVTVQQVNDLIQAVFGDERPKDADDRNQPSGWI